jgi:hypothetical protein
VSKYRNGITACVLAVSLSNCAGVPALDLPNKGITVHRIVNRIKCEILQGAEAHEELKEWVAVANLTVQVDDEGSLVPSVAFIHPLAAASTSFVFNVGANITADRERIYSENFSVDIGTLRKKKNTCDAYADQPLTGDLGIVETVDLGFHSLKAGGPVDFDPVNGDAFGETIQFILTENLNGVGPTWTLVHFKGPTGPLVGVQHKDTNKLIISFAPKSAPAKQAKGKLTPAFTSLGVTPSANSAAQNNNLQMLIQSTHGGGVNF